MKVILLEDVKSLGKKGDLVNVSDGYARNLIFPKKLGVEANAKNLNDLKLRKANEVKVAQENLDAAKAFAKSAARVAHRLREKLLVLKFSTFFFDIVKRILEAYLHIGSRADVFRNDGQHRFKIEKIQRVFK